MLRKISRLLVIFTFCYVILIGVIFELWYQGKLSSGSLLSWIVPCSAFLVGIHAFATQLRDARKQIVAMKEISRSMSTQYIGDFPMHIRDIIDLVKKTRERLWIMADCVDYGGFSAPKLHDDLVRAIEDASRRHLSGKKVEVTLLLYGDGAPISRGSPFFGYKFDELHAKEDSRAPKELKKEFNHCLTNFLEWNNISTEPEDHEEFITMLKSHHKQVRDRLCSAGVDIVSVPESAEKPGLFFWIGDGENAVFLLSHSGATQRLAFWTRDSKLVDAFKSTFTKHEKQNSGAKTAAATIAQ